MFLLEDEGKEAGDLGIGVLGQVAGSKFVELGRNAPRPRWLVGEKLDLLGDFVEARIVTRQQCSESSSNVHILDTR